MEEKKRIYSGKKYHQEHSTVKWLYSFKYPGQKSFWARTEESPEEYKKRTMPQDLNSKEPSMDDEVFILHKGVRYTELDLDKIRDQLYENYIPKNNHENDINFNPRDSLTADELDELSEWKIKIKASSWKSRQRSLRKKNKLDQYKIDSLNKLGMVWDPKEDEWEKKYLVFRKNGFCDEIELWINEQRALNESNELSNENLYRLEAVDFPFNPSPDESFPFTLNSLDNLNEKLRKKKRRLELKLIKNPPKKLSSKQKKIIVSEKERKQQQQQQKPVNSFYTKLYMVNGKTNSKVQNLSFKEAKIVIKKIESGLSIYNRPTKEYLDNVVKNKTLGHFTKSFVKDFYDNLKPDLSKKERYDEISVFSEAHVNIETRIYACKTLLNYYEFIADKKMKTFKPLDCLISNYEKEKDVKELSQLKIYIEKYPMLFELYNYKINKILSKV